MKLFCDVDFDTCLKGVKQNFYEYTKNPDKIEAVLNLTRIIMQLPEFIARPFIYFFSLKNSVFISTCPRFPFKFYKNGIELIEGVTTTARIGACRT